MRSEGHDKVFTLLQGEIYGKRIKEAEPADGLIGTLKKLKEMNKKMAIVSHKTRVPYEGPAYDLHKSAMEWLIDQRIAGDENALIPTERIFFEPSIEKKVERIKTLKCTYFVDDLKSVLNKIPENINKVLYDPSGKAANSEKVVQIMRTWKEGVEIFCE